MPSKEFWTEILDTLRALRADVQRLAGVVVVPEGEIQQTKRLDWSRFLDTRKAAAEEQERYWREMGSPAAGQ